MADRRYIGILIASVLLPLFELLALAFASFVFTYDVGRYLLADGRIGAGIAVLVLFWLLLALMIAPFLRNIYTLCTDPPFVKHDDVTEMEHERSLFQSGTVLPQYKFQKPKIERSLENFWNPKSMLIYTCEGDGLPRRCQVCSEWKPDRAHHSSDLARCIERMDHFCPWFGGIVGRSNHKFFLQFIAFTALWCVFGIVVLGVMINEQRIAGHQHSGQFIRMCVCIALQALFGNFTGAMTYGTLLNVLENLTDVEAVQNGPWTLAINVDALARRAQYNNTTTPPKYATRYFWPNRSVFIPANSPQWHSVATEADDAQAFAIVTTNAGENPFDLGSRMTNFRSLMGNNIIDWLLPIRGSPHTLDSFGPLVNVLASRYNLPNRS